MMKAAVELKCQSVITALITECTERWIQYVTKKWKEMRKFSPHGHVREADSGLSVSPSKISLAFWHGKMHENGDAGLAARQRKEDPTTHGHGGAENERDGTQDHEHSRYEVEDYMLWRGCKHPSLFLRSLMRIEPLVEHDSQNLARQITAYPKLWA